MNSLAARRCAPSRWRNAPARALGGLECASRKKYFTFTGAVFVIYSQPLDTPQENPCTYGLSVSEPTIYGYVEGNPLMYSDPLGLWKVEDIFPDGAPIVTIGRAFGGVVAYGEGALTGNSALSNAAMEGLQCSRAENMDAFGIMLSMGRGGRQSRLRDLANDGKLGAADRGWLQQEINSINRGQRASIRNPPGKDLAHERGREAAKGYDYNHSNLQDRDLHRSQHKYDDFGRANVERPLNGGVIGGSSNKCGCP
jgi:Bacterial toxin 8